VSRRFQVVEKLGFFNSGEFLQCLQLDNNPIEADEVHTVISRQPTAFVENRNMDFALEWNILFSQFMLKRLLIDRFQKSAAKLAMDLHRRPDNGMRPRIFIILIWHNVASQFTLGSRV